MKNKPDPRIEEGLKRWYFFKRDVLGKHSKFWNYPKEETIKELETFLKQDLQQIADTARKEAVEEIEKWMYQNGITDKKSFVALKNKLAELAKPKGENGKNN